MQAAGILILLVLLLTASCSRREMYVYGDEFQSVELLVDWNNYSGGAPDGMTVWFYPLDRPEHPPYRSTTANVHRHGLYLPGGRYEGIVVDYSPDEFSHQQFLGMDTLQRARVEVTAMGWQPDSMTVSGEGVPKTMSQQVNEQLFSDLAWTAEQTDRPPLYDLNGLYTVANQPEVMALDTLTAAHVDPGPYGDYIPWQQRDTYQSSIVVTTLYAAPFDIIWNLRIRVHIENGYDYLWQTPASISGLADGHYLPLHANTARSCLLYISEWTQRRTGDNRGYIEAFVSTFGLRPDALLTGDLRLNLAFVLRDRSTLVPYHFNIGDRVEVIDNELVMRVEVGPVSLPYADPYNGAGFGAEVTPWEDQPPVDIHF